MPNKDYYRVLGVDEKASTEEIKRAYRRLAKENHPDAHPGDKQAELRFKEISEAYSILSDPQKRQQYDQMRRFGFAGTGGFQTQGFGIDLSDLFGGSARTGSGRGRRPLDDFFGFGGLGDLFSQIFERDSGFGAATARSQKGRDIQVAVEIPLETAVHGGKAVFVIEKDDVCRMCRGTGVQGGGQLATCPDCHGTGMVSRAQGAFAVSRPCPRCLGQGSLNTNPCRACSGTGQQKAKKKYSVNIAPGTPEGHKLRLSGQGAPGAQGGPAGDLIVTVRIGKHRFFEARGLDIYCEVPIDKKQARSGTKVKVKTVYGNSVLLTVPPNSNGGKIFKLQGMGIRGKNRKGDQYVKIRVV